LIGFQLTASSLEYIQGGFFMSIAFVLGNGLSRQGIDLHRLSKFGAIYGCNLLYKDFTPTALVATDRPIATEIQESGYSGRARFLTRHPIDGLGAQKVPKKYHGNSSGPIATAVAALDGAKRIYMLGFDMGPSPIGKFNNVYANTQHYKKTSDQPTYTGNWIKQIVTITKDFPHSCFIRVMGDTTADIKEFNDLSNFEKLPLTQFLERINNEKDI
jgi:hypothetical protein